jgi:TonB family protein
MGVPVQPLGAGENELNLYPQYQSRESEVRAWRARAVSVGLHLTVVCLFAFTPLGGVRVHDINRIVGEFKNPVRLVAPPSTLTQRAPNQGKVGKEFNLQSLMPRPPAFIPPSVAPGAPPSRPSAPLIDPPKFDSGQSPRPFGTDLSVLSPPPPQIQPEEKPKLAFEPPRPAEIKPPGTGRFTAPPPSVTEMGRDLARGGRPGGQAVTDYSGLLGGAVDAPNGPLAPGSVGSGLELLSDSRGVDFRSYLTQILAAVKRNWQAVLPESARRGERRGKVTVRFSVSRDGKVTNVQITVPSGTEALDLAAIAGISATNPFPPLPPEYNGLPIRLQFVFLYNMRPY